MSACVVTYTCGLLIKNYYPQKSKHPHQGHPLSWPVCNHGLGLILCYQSYSILYEVYSLHACKNKFVVSKVIGYYSCVTILMDQNRYSCIFTCCLLSFHVDWQATTNLWTVHSQGSLAQFVNVWSTQSLVVTWVDESRPQSYVPFQFSRVIHAQKQSAIKIYILWSSMEYNWACVCTSYFVSCDMSNSIVGNKLLIKL